MIVIGALPLRYQAEDARLPLNICPIEAGQMLRLADNECDHGRLPGDRTPPCGCWSEEARA